MVDEKYPGINLIRALNALQSRLQRSGVERTLGLKDAMGNDCIYYRRSLDLFLKRDYTEILELVRDVIREFDSIEGNHIKGSGC